MLFQGGLHNGDAVSAARVCSATTAAARPAVRLRWSGTFPLSVERLVRERSAMLTAGRCSCSGVSHHLGDAGGLP